MTRRRARDARGSGVLAVVALVGVMVGCGDEPTQVRFRAEFVESEDLLVAPVCLGAAGLQGFVLGGEPAKVVGRVSEVPAWQDGEGKCRITPAILVVKGVSFGSARVLRLEVVDSTKSEVLSAGDSEPIDLSGSGPESEGVPTFSVTLKRRTLDDVGAPLVPGTVHLVFPADTDFSPMAGGDIGVLFDGNEWQGKREIPVPEDLSNWDPEAILLSNLPLDSGMALTVFGRDSKGAETSRWTEQSVFAIETDKLHDWSVAEARLVEAQ